MLTRFAAFRSLLYARMEEISFRAAITVVTGVVAVAAVIAGVGLLMAQAPAPDRSTALGSSPAARFSARAPAPTSASPSPSPPASSAPARTPAPVKTSPAREATYPATAENAQRAPVTRAAAPPVTARRPLSSAAAGWLAWWQHVLASRHGGGLGIGHGGLGGGHWGRR